MIGRTLVYLTLLLIVCSLTLVRTCPCALIENDAPAILTADASSGSLLLDDDSAEDDFDQLPSANKYDDVYPLFRDVKSSLASRKRFKRPSWATVGKRAVMAIKKRPSWAQVG